MPFWYPFLVVLFWYPLISSLHAFESLFLSCVIALFLFLHHVHSYSWVTMAFFVFWSWISNTSIVGGVFVFFD
jgi:hypothetical protein